MKKILLLSLPVLVFANSYAQLKTKDYVDYFSTTSCLVTINKSGNKMGTGTGFFVRNSDSAVYFVTNNHVAGLEFLVNDYIRRNALPAHRLIPDELIVKIYSDSLGKYKYLSIPLFKNGLIACIKIYENEKDTTTILDVVAIPISKSESSGINPKHILSKVDMQDSLVLAPAADLFIVGFPLSFAASIYPIWKKATVASEANFWNVGNSTFVVDGTGRQGMSGSPVFYRMMSLEGNVRSMSVAGHTTYLVGIYSAQWFAEELGNVIRLDKLFAKINKR